MIKHFLKRNCTQQNVVCKRSIDDVPVESGLAMTPAQMNEMMNRGLPISTQNLGLAYEEGVSSLDFEPPIEHRRGIDMNDLYESRERIRKNFRSKLKEFRANETKDVQTD